MCGSSAFATCSRDKTVRVWREAIGGGHGFVQGTVCVGHASFVTAVAYAPPGVIPSMDPGQWGLVSASRDTRVVAWDPNTGGEVAAFAGHSLDVTAVCVLPSGKVVSGAMDKTIRVWDAAGGACVRTLTGHESSVLCLLALPTGGFLSGSADATVRRWEGEGEAGAAAKVMRGHSDTVRGLALMPGVGYLTASHDCTARLWTHGGDCAVVFAGHTALVYAVCALPNGAVVTGSEDNTARVWRASDGACMQTIAHPGCVWSVGGFAESGDVVTACADGVARVWTRDAEKADADAAAAMAAAMTAVEEARARANLADQQSKIKTEEPSALGLPGASDGATKVIREEGGTIAAYAWSAGTASWERLGEVTGVGGGGRGKKEYLGVEYDYVFDVDISEGQPTLKLPFNRGDNPYAAAERFLEDNGLDPGFREQVVNFIVQNVGETNLTQGTNADPYTGGGAYVPGSGGGFGAGIGGGDPYTGGGAYVPGGGASIPATGGGGGNADPFTGGGAYTPSGAAPAQCPTSGGPFTFLPMRQCLFFETAKFEGILKKLAEFGARVDPVLGGEGESAMGRCAAFASGAVSSLDPPAMDALVGALSSWPLDTLFPLLDLARAVVLRGGEALTPEVAAALAEATVRAVTGADPPPAANLLTGGRLFCNAFKHPEARHAFLNVASAVLVRHLLRGVVYLMPRILGCSGRAWRRLRRRPRAIGTACCPDLVFYDAWLACSRFVFPRRASALPSSPSDRSWARGGNRGIGFYARPDRFPSSGSPASRLSAPCLVLVPATDVLPGVRRSRQSVPRIARSCVARHMPGHPRALFLGVPLARSFLAALDACERPMNET